MDLHDLELTPDQYGLLTENQQLIYEQALRDRKQGKRVGVVLHKSGHLYQISYADHYSWHRDPTEGPALILWYENGLMEQKDYFVKQKLHRDSNQGPARQSWHDNGQKSERIYCEDGQMHLHYLLGPAEKTWDEDGSKATEMYLSKGKFHRDPRQGPAYNAWVDGEFEGLYQWKGEIVDEHFIPPEFRPTPDGLGRVFL